MPTNGRNRPLDWASMPDWITTAEAVDISGYHSDYLRRLMREGKIAGEKKGQMWWIDRDSLQSYLAQMESLGSRKHDPRGQPVLETE